MHKYIRIARMGLWLGATVFGGINVAYPVIRERARELADLTGEEVDGLYALAVAMPGPSFLNLWGAVSAEAGGLIGAFIGEVALLFPAFALVFLLPLTTRIPWVQAHADGALYGAIWTTAGLLIATGIEGLRKEKASLGRLAAGLGLAALLLGIHPVLLLLLFISFGALAAWRHSERKAA